MRGIESIRTILNIPSISKEVFGISASFIIYAITILHSNCGGAWGHFRDLERFLGISSRSKPSWKKNIVKSFNYFIFAKSQHSVSRFMPCPSIGPKLFWTVQIVLVGSRSFWSNNFVQVQIRLFWTIFYNLYLTKTNWTCPKQFVLDQNHFGPIEGIGQLTDYLFFYIFYHIF